MAQQNQQKQPRFDSKRTAQGNIQNSTVPNQPARSSLEAIASGVSIKEAVKANQSTQVRKTNVAKPSSTNAANKTARQSKTTKRRASSAKESRLAAITDKHSLQSVKFDPIDQRSAAQTASPILKSDKGSDNQGSQGNHSSQESKVIESQCAVVAQESALESKGSAQKQQQQKQPKHCASQDQSADLMDKHQPSSPAVTEGNGDNAHQLSENVNKYCSSTSLARPDNQNDPRYLEQRKHGTRIFPIDCHHWRTENGPCYGIWHWHPEVEIMHMVEGKGLEIEFADRHFVIDAPAICVVPSGVLHRIDFDRSFNVYSVLGKANHTLFDPSILEMMRFDEALNNTLGALEGRMLGLSTPILSTDLGFAELDAVLNFIDDHAKDKDAGMRLQVKGNLLQFLGILHSYGYLNNHHIERPLTQVNNNNEERIKEIFDYINHNYNRPISIIDISSRLGISKQYFCRLFKSLTSMSFVEYLNNVRLNNAAQDILLSSDPINDIAERHGFDSISYFFKVFKQQFNCTPNTFRQRKGMVKE